MMIFATYFHSYRLRDCEIRATKNKFEIQITLFEKIGWQVCTLYHYQSEAYFWMGEIASVSLRTVNDYES